jgi:GH43 family beta-xylosidase
MTATFRNPLNPGPDPFLTFYAGDYYLSTTQGDALRIWKSPSLGGLATAEPTTVWQETDSSRNQQMWAPSFHLIGGHWYFYYCADDGQDENHRLYVLKSAGTDPLGPYEFGGKLAPPGSDDWAIDAELLQHGGELYLLWSGASELGHNLLFIAPMSDPCTVSGPRVYLPSAGGCPEVREAPAILQRDGTTFLVYSTCDTGKPDYQLWMHALPAGADPLVPGNWRQHPTAVFTRSDGAGVFGPGSNGFFLSPQGDSGAEPGDPDAVETWIVYHGKETSDYTYAGRSTRAQRFGWNADGTPDFGVPLALDTDVPLPSGDPGLS